MLSSFAAVRSPLLRSIDRDVRSPHLRCKISCLNSCSHWDCLGNILFIQKLLMSSSLLLIIIIIIHIIISIIIVIIIIIKSVAVFSSSTSSCKGKPAQSRGRFEDVSVSRLYEVHVVVQVSRSSLSPPSLC